MTFHSNTHSSQLCFKGFVDLTQISHVEVVMATEISFKHKTYSKPTQSPQ